MIYFYNSILKRFSNEKKYCQEKLSAIEAEKEFSSHNFSLSIYHFIILEDNFDAYHFWLFRKFSLLCSTALLGYEILPESHLMIKIQYK